MPGWNSFHDWMAFDRLDEGDGLTRAFAIGYRLSDDRADPWTRRFNGFKDKRLAALRGGAEVIGSAVPGLVRGLGLDAANTVFVPALSSGETVASENGVLWRLTHYCAAMAQVGFVGDAITKRAHERLHRYSNADRRREILDGAEFRSGRIGAENIVVLGRLHHAWRNDVAHRASHSGGESRSQDLWCRSRQDGAGGATGRGLMSKSRTRKCRSGGREYGTEAENG